MARHSKIPLFVLLGLGALAGCSKFEHAERPAWRAHAENVCFAEKRVAFSDYIRPAAHDIDGPSICGLTRPLKVTALQHGTVLLNSTQTLDCSMVAALDEWLADVVQPAAQARFGQPVAQIDSMGSYNCRGMNNQIGAKLSEHSFGNAIDVGGFRLADGRKITLVHDWWHGDAVTQAFLHDVHNGACDRFSTVLSPGANIFHYNHMHVDLAMHGMTSTGRRHICKPARQQTAPPPRKDDLPDAPAIDDDIDSAEAGPPRGAPPTPCIPVPTLRPRMWPPRIWPVRKTPAPTWRSPPGQSPRPIRRGVRSIRRPRLAGLMIPAPRRCMRAPPQRKNSSPTRPRRGIMREDGSFEPEGAPTDFDLPTSRYQR